MKKIVLWRIYPENKQYGVSGPKIVPEDAARLKAIVKEARESTDDVFHVDWSGKSWLDIQILEVQDDDMIDVDIKHELTVSNEDDTTKKEEGLKND